MKSKLMLLGLGLSLTTTLSAGWLSVNDDRNYRDDVYQEFFDKVPFIGDDDKMFDKMPFVGNDNRIFDKILFIGDDDDRIFDKMPFVGDNDRFFGKRYKKTYRSNKVKMPIVYPKMNIFEEEKTYVFEYNVAGIDKEDIKIEIISENTLVIKSIKTNNSITVKKSNQKQKVLRQERFHGTFIRSTTLPDNIDTNKVKVTHNNGILKVTIDKKVISINKKDTKVLSIK
jgi:HSP20 family protein